MSDENTTPPPLPKKGDGKFKPGQSGNPAGKPKSDTTTVSSLAKDHTKAAIETLVHIMTKSKKASARIAAAKAILDRGWGKPAQAVTLKGDAEAPLVVQAIKFGDTVIKF